MKIYLELDYEESVLVLWALKDLYQFNAEIANDEYLQRLQGLIKKAGDSLRSSIFGLKVKPKIEVVGLNPLFWIKFC